MIPLISSMCMGPLGVRQLPRTWWKVLLRSADLLDPAYPDCSRELDDWCLRALELDKDATLAFVRAEKPTYLQFEAWVMAQKNGHRDQARIDRWNEGVEKRVHVNPGKIEETYSDIGFDKQEIRITSAVVLNCMQDWALFHRNDLLRTTSDLPFSMAPLISSLDKGPLGVCQLPRTWLKVILKAKGRLHPEYPDCGGGLDTGVIEVLGLEKEQTLDYLRTGLPTYLQFETWVREQTGDAFDWEKIERWHQFLFNRVHPEKKRADIHATIGRTDDGTLVHGVILNHLEDWAFGHRAVMHCLDSR